MNKNIIIIFVVMSVLIMLLELVVMSAYDEYKAQTDIHKEKCLDKFKAIEYEVVSDVLYCKTDDGLVKFK